METKQKSYNLQLNLIMYHKENIVFKQSAVCVLSIMLHCRSWEMFVFAKVFQSYKNEKVRLSFQDKNCSRSCSPTGSIHSSLISAESLSKESMVTWQRRFHIISVSNNIVVFLTLSKECLISVICFYLLQSTVGWRSKQSKTVSLFQ